MLVNDTDRPVDIEYVREYGCDHICWSELIARLAGEKSFVSQLVEIFVTDNAQRIEDMDFAIADSQMETLVRIAHSMKGAAYSVSAIRLSELAEKMEDVAGSAQVVGVEELMEALRQEFGVLKEIMTMEGWMEILESIGS